MVSVSPSAKEYPVNNGPQENFGPTVLVPSYLLSDLAAKVGFLGRAIENLPKELPVNILETGGGRLNGSCLAQNLQPQNRLVLSLMAQGHSDRLIAATLGIAQESVQDQIGRIYQVLNLTDDSRMHPRVRAVLEYLDYKLGTVSRPITALFSRAHE